MWRRTAPMDFSTAAAIMLTYLAWLTLIVFCAAPAFFPVGIAHKIGGW